MESMTLKGIRREIPREEFEELVALQCGVQEIIGYVGITRDGLRKWCKAVYGETLDKIMEMVRQDGLIEIRRASFEALRKSAPLIQQQYARFLSGDGNEKDKALKELTRVWTTATRVTKDNVKETYADEHETEALQP